MTGSTDLAEAHPAGLGGRCVVEDLVNYFWCLIHSAEGARERLRGCYRIESPPILALIQGEGDGFLRARCSKMGRRRHRLTLFLSTSHFASLASLRYLQIVY